ncbi:MAG TPA: hypothetical protein VES42_22625 [Pilimelia sp.]|nr:hypothetical protein [Pilimelia sp.]
MTQPGEDLALGAHVTPDERALEAPAQDAVEQATVANPVHDVVEVHRGLEVAEWDAVEQAQIVEFDDEYR